MITKQQVNKQTCFVGLQKCLNSKKTGSRLFKRISRKNNKKNFLEKSPVTMIIT